MSSEQSTNSITQMIEQLCSNKVVKSCHIDIEFENENVKADIDVKKVEPATPAPEVKPAVTPKRKTTVTPTGLMRSLMLEHPAIRDCAKVIVFYKPNVYERCLINPLLIGYVDSSNKQHKLITGNVPYIIKAASIIIRDRSKYNCLTIENELKQYYCKKADKDLDYYPAHNYSVAEGSNPMLDKLA